MSNLGFSALFLSERLDSAEIPSENLAQTFRRRIVGSDESKMRRPFSFPGFRKRAQADHAKLRAGGGKQPAPFLSVSGQAMPAPFFISTAFKKGAGGFQAFNRRLWALAASDRQRPFCVSGVRYLLRPFSRSRITQKEAQTIAEQKHRSLLSHPR